MTRKPRRATSGEGGPADQDEFELLSLRATDRLSMLGLLGGLASFGLVLWTFRDSSGADEVLPAALGTLLTFVGALLGHAHGASSGRSEASRARRDASDARKEADLLRDLVRTYEAALPRQTRALREGRRSLALRARPPRYTSRGCPPETQGGHQPST